MAHAAEALESRVMDPHPSLAPILVVEDEPLIALDIEDSIGALGAPVRVARSLAEASLIIATPPRPRLVLLDVVLPDGRSFDLAHQLLSLGIPLVFLTGYDHGIPDTLRHIAVIEKPFSTDSLVAVVMRSSSLG
jgi:DNA-binding response OmpR family regulator